MSKTTLTLFLAVLGVTMLVASHLGAQSAQQPQKWEYGFIEKSTTRFRTGEKVFAGKEGFKSVYSALGGAKPPSDPQRAEDAVFQLLGQGGWELTTTDADRIYFKRPIS